MSRLVIVMILLAAACKKGEPVVFSDPASGPQSGYYEVRFDISEADIDGTVSAVRIGGINAYDVVHQGEEVSVIVQGSAAAGPTDVEMITSSGVQSFEGGFEYDRPVDPLFDRMAAMGASLTQGTAGGVPTYEAILASPPHLLARRGGAFLPLPLLTRGLFPTIGPEDIGSAPECLAPDVVNFIAEASVEVIGKLNDEEQDRIGFYLGRVDPDLEPHDVAVGGSNIADLVNGTAGDFGKQFVTKLVYAPYADIIEDVHVSQLELVEAIEPTLVISTDIYGNDLIGAIVESSFIDTDKLTPVEDVRLALTTVVERLEATGAEVFLANMPHATVLPATADKRAAAIENARNVAQQTGEDPDQAMADEAIAVDARIQLVEDVGDAYNAILDELASTRPTIHVVDFGARVADVEAEGLEVDGELLTVRKYGGLLSTDGVHFSDAGYAMFANLFIETINAELGLDMPEYDLAPIVMTDPYSPAALRAGGLDPTLCDGT